MPRQFRLSVRPFVCPSVSHMRVLRIKRVLYKQEILDNFNSQGVIDVVVITGNYESWK